MKDEFAPSPGPRPISAVGATGRDKFLRNLAARYISTLPSVATWSGEDILRHRAKLEEALGHVRGDCARLARRKPSYLVHTVLMPTHRPGEFVQAICTKAREVIVEDYLAGAGFPERFLRLKLADLDESDAKKRALSYVERFNECKREGKGLVIAGGVGTGKTQLMTSLGLELIERYVFVSITFTTCHKFLQLHREAMQDDMAQEELDSIYYDSDLVLIDDIGANRFSDYDIAVFGNFIDERYSKLLPVVLTTNLDIRDLEECVGERVISRLKEMCEVVLLTGEDRRGKLRSAPSTDER